METLNFTVPDEFGNVLIAAAAVANKPHYTEVLQGVRLHTRDDMLCITACDSFSLLDYTTLSETAQGVDVILPVADVKRLASSLNRRGASAILTVTGPEVRHGNVTAVGWPTAVIGDYPNTESLFVGLDDDYDEAHVGPIRLGQATLPFLAALGKAVNVITLVTHFSNPNTKPIKVVTQVPGLRVLVMPVRQ